MAAAEKEEKKKIDLKSTMERLNKAFGKGSVISANQKPEKIESISTGSLGIDIATGIGGFPRGRIIEIIAPEATGKTTLCLHLIANAQKLGFKCAYVDMEHALDFGYAKKLGVNVDELILSQPSYGEAALEIAHQLILTNEFRIIIVDSVASLVSKAEVDGEIGDSGMARQGRMMSQALRVLNPIVEQHDCMLVFPNQIRMQPGVMYGSPEVPAGGNSLKFYASMRLDMRKTVSKEGQLNKTRVKIIKNKVAIPFQEAEVELVWGEGFNRMSEIIDIAVDLDIIQKSGSWFAYGESKIGQGRDAVKQLFLDNPELAQEIEEKVLEKLKPVVKEKTIIVAEPVVEESIIQS